MGWAIYLPHFAPHSRVDLVAVRGSEILRVQVKTASVRSGFVFFRTCSNTKNEPRSYEGEVDAFGVHCPALGRTYLVSIDGLGGRGCQLRLTPAANNQIQGVRWAADYEVSGPPREADDHVERVRRTGDQ